ncbi:hypothetical protein F4861DRAFT_540874 [Xylaria intraflava]|nr:hypothetical protein F4861DRAFT_540874 [Xylaria intraflava]
MGSLVRLLCRVDSLNREYAIVVWMVPSTPQAYGSMMIFALFHDQADKIGNLNSSAIIEALANGSTHLAHSRAMMTFQTRASDVTIDARSKSMLLATGVLAMIAAILALHSLSPSQRRRRRRLRPHLCSLVSKPRCEAKPQ